MIPDEIEMVRAAAVRVGPLYTMDPGNPSVCACYLGERCKSPAKHPLSRACPNGKDDFTTDRDQLYRWAQEFPGSNWGGRPADGVVVVDVDPRNGGHDSLTKLELQYGPMPQTLTAKTGGGGLHLWFTGPTTRGKLGDDYPGLDIKTGTGLLVLPPSVHASGNRYEWLELRSAEYTPEWLHDLLNPPRTQIRVGSHMHPAGLVKFIRTCSTNRNNALFWAACRIAEQGGDPYVLTEAAVECGLEPEEIDKTLRSAAKTYGKVAS